MLKLFWHIFIIYSSVEYWKYT